jgi:hypothetical protein
MIETKITFDRGGQTSETAIRENWILQESGEVLAIKFRSQSGWGERNITLIFDKR